MRTVIKNWLSRRYASGVIISVAMLLTASSLNTGLVADDFFHKLVLKGGSDVPGIPSDPLKLFVWASGDERTARSFMDTGMTGWWTDPSLVLAFWRPVTVLTHWLDYQLWPESPLLMHLHNLLWFALALVLLWNVYRRLVNVPVPNETTADLSDKSSAQWAAALALLMFAWDDAHGLTVSWIANRNALVAFTIALLVLLLYHRARNKGCRASAIAAPLVFAIALQAGEIAIAICAYLFAYAIFLDQAGWKRGLIHLFPYVLIVLAWSGFYYVMGYGAHGSGLVIDPAREPGHYLLAVLERLPILLLGQIAVPPTDLWEFYPTVGPFVPLMAIAWALLVLGAVALSIRPLIAREKTTRFWLCGGLLSAVPACAQFPHDRLLLFIGMGIMATLAQLIAAFIERADWLASSLFSGRSVSIVAGSLMFLHLVFGPLILPFRSRGPADINKIIARADSTIDDSPAVRQQSIILLNPPVDALAGYIPTMRAATGRNRPKHLRWLATGASQLTVQRVDERTLRVEPADGFLSLASERMQRDPRNVMNVGYTVAYPDLEIKVSRLTNDGRPAEILATFVHPLEDKRFEFLRWSPKGFVPFALPRVGQTVELEAVDLISLFEKRNAAGDD
jgi:hypothetical protein